MVFGVLAYYKVVKLFRVGGKVAIGIINMTERPQSYRAAS